MISWHKVGQAVTPVDKASWQTIYLPTADHIARHPEDGKVYTISSVQVCCHTMVLGFTLKELDKADLYGAAGFRPVYPQQIEALRKLCEPTRKQEAECVTRRYEPSL